MTNAKDITPPDSAVQVFLEPLSKEHKAEQKQWAAEQAGHEARQAALEEARASGAAKLLALGLNDLEIEALTGIASVGDAS